MGLPRTAAFNNRIAIASLQWKVLYVTFAMSSSKAFGSSPAIARAATRAAHIRHSPFRVIICAAVSLVAEIGIRGELYPGKLPEPATETGPRSHLRCRDQSAHVPILPRTSLGGKPDLNCVGGTY